MLEVLTNKLQHQYCEAKEEKLCQLFDKLSQHAQQAGTAQRTAEEYLQQQVVIEETALML